MKGILANYRINMFKIPCNCRSKAGLIWHDVMPKDRLWLKLGGGGGGQGEGQFQTEHPVVQHTPPKSPEMHKLDFHIYGRRFNHEFAHMFGHVWWSTK